MDGATVLVTGSSGFVGGRVVELIVAQTKASHVRIVNRPKANLSHLQPLIDAKRVQCYTAASLEDEQALRLAMKGCNIVVHCAALATDWARPEEFESANVRGVEVLCKLALEARLARFVYISTTDVFGYPPHTVPDDDHPLVEINLPYNQSKVRGEKIVWRYIADLNLPATILRPVNVYGPRGKDFVKEILDALRDGTVPLVAGGHETSGMVYVDHIAQACIQCVTTEKANGQAYNLCDEPAVTWKAYFNLIAAEAGYRKPWFSLPFYLCYFLGWLMEFIYWAVGKYDSRPLLTRHAVILLGTGCHAASQKARAHFGYKETVGMEEGIKRSVQWYKAQK